MNKKFYIPLIIPIIFGMIFIFLSFSRHKNFHSSIYDLGLYDNINWNTFQGKTLYSSLYVWNELPNRNFNHLGDHFNLIYILLAPLNLFSDTAYPLLLLQVLSIVICGVYLFKFSEKSIYYGLFIQIIFFLNPIVQQVLLLDFHPTVIVILLGIMSIYYFRINKLFIFFILLILMSMCKESCFLLSACILFGCFILKKNIKFLQLSIIFIILFVFIVNYIMPQIKGDSSISLQYLLRYDYIGASIGNVIKNCIVHPIYVIKKNIYLDNIRLFFLYFWPFIFIPLFNVRIIFGIPLFLLNFLATFSEHKILESYHHNLVLVFILWAFISNVRNIRKFVKKGSFILLLIILINLIIFNFMFLKLWNSDEYRKNNFHRTEKTKILDKMTKIISKNDSVKAFQSLGTKFAHRINYKDFSWERFEETNEKWVLIDLNSFKGKEGSIEVVENLINTQNYGVRNYIKGFLLLEKNYKEKWSSILKKDYNYRKKIYNKAFYLLPKPERPEIFIAVQKNGSWIYEKYIIERLKKRNANITPSYFSGKYKKLIWKK